MNQCVFNSSDRGRSAAPLRSAQRTTFSDPLVLELGGQLPSVTVTYETYGTLNATRDNAVLVCHAISGDSHVARHDDHDALGWWDILVGPGRPIVISFSSDWLFPPEQSRQIVDALIAANRPVTYCNVDASGGHDSFLLEEKLSIHGGLIQAFTAQVDDTGPARAPDQSVPRAQLIKPTNIFHGHRLDYDIVLPLIPPAASVLDLGCGDGVLLSHLRERGHRDLVGVELDEESLLACVDQGLDVVQHNLEQGLSPFAAGQFDVVVLSQTLQSIMDTEGIVEEMLRVGHSCIVSFPNFAYHKLRKMLCEEGRSPKAGGVCQFDWYNTPHRRFPSIADVEEFCARKAIRVQQKLYLDSETRRRITDAPNRNADMAIFVLRS